jgi:two-component system, chemotaxis family, chemotaxis protein CheY
VAHALIIDDSRAMRSLLRRMVVQMGFETIEAEHGQAGLDALATNGPVTIALVDWNMPVMDGLEFVRSARDNRDYDRMRIMMVTSEASPRNVYEAMKAGADEYAMKPVTVDVLADKMHLLGVTTPAEAAAGVT